jgi:hypothetical protein
MEEMPARIGADVRRGRVYLGALLLVFLVADRAHAQGLWVPEAPGPNTLGQVENIADGEVVGAIQAVAVHPIDPDIVWVAAVNGGVWRTNDGTAAAPHWQPLTDDQPSLSFGALELDPTDATYQTLVAGTGCFTSYAVCGRAEVGLLRTTNGGASWTVIDGAGRLIGLRVSGVAPRGSTLVISVNRALDPADVGLWRSTDGGAGWDRVSGADGTGLPAGAATDLAGDRATPNRLFTSIAERGVYRSTDTGAQWKKVSSAAMDTRLAAARNARIAVGADDNVYVAIVGSSGRLSAVFRSPDGGGSWKAMDLPGTVEGGIHPGAQGATHLSLAADPVEPGIVYIGGDAQPPGRLPFPEPNSIGAIDYTGRLFRGDATRRAGRQWVHLTHSRSLGAAGGGTAGGSAPHADSRDLVIVADGALIEVDDGGIYRRTEPRSNTGDWHSMNGDLQVTELHAVAWDRNAGIAIGGAQDTGTPQQRLRSNARWASVSTGDGGVVAVEDGSSPRRSTRYSSSYELGDFRWQIYDAANVLLDEYFPPRDPEVGSSVLVPQFYSPVVVNPIDPDRLVIGGKNSVFESFNRGETVLETGPGVVANPSGGGAIAYGAAANPDLLYVGSGATFLARTAPPPAALQPEPSYPGGTVVDIALDPTRPMTAFVVDPDRVYRTPDAGRTWTDITGNLSALTPGALRSIAYSWSDAAAMVVVGSDSGVFAATGPALTAWSRLGSGLPRVPVHHLEFDPFEGVLLAGTLGRGAWRLATPPAPALPLPPPPPPLPAPDVVVVRDAMARDAQPRDGARAFQLRPGIWIDTAASRAYLMSPNGEVEAVDLASGAEVWRTRAAEKPLGLVDGFLVGQLEPADDGNNGMRVVVLDAANGQRLLGRAVALPAGVESFVMERAESTFEAVAQGTGNEAIVAWEVSERPMRGIHPLAEGMLPPPPSARVPATRAGGEDAPADATASGAFELDLKTGAVSAVDARNVASDLVSRNEMKILSRDLPQLGARQVLSADGRHVLVSERTSEGGERTGYRLTIYERGTRSRVGELRSRLAVVPFVVTGPRLVYETPTFARRSGSEMIRESRAIHAIDLATGAEVWRRPVRDTTYRGPYPP